MKGISNPDGWVRLDFPGGWKGDKKNAFTREGLSAEEVSVQDLVKQLAGFRKGSSALGTGKLMQYVPKDGLYVYFRYDARQTVMCVMNTADGAATIDFSRYDERTAGFTRAVDILSGRSYALTEKLQIPSMQMWILELKK
jgi:hypothetical protein